MSNNGPCNNFQMVAAWLMGANATTMFSCEIPAKPLEPHPGAAMPYDLPVHMHGMRMVWPTATVEACETQALKTGAALLSAGESRPVTCETAKGDVLSSFKVEKTCAPASASSPEKCDVKIVRPPKNSLDAKR